MKFRPCIDIHNGKVKQIVGGSLRDEGNQATENFASEMDADYYADLYRKDSLKGGHIILLNPPSSEYYKKTLEQAEKEGIVRFKNNYDFYVLAYPEKVNFFRVRRQWQNLLRMIRSKI